MPVVVAFLLVLVLVLGVLVALPVLIPVSLALRYRTGTSRQRARGWLATINVAALFVSVAVLLASAAVTSLWEPLALPSAAGGLALGGVLGILGLSLSRWEPAPDALHFTPNRWLVSAILLVVAARIGWGLWRTWQSLSDAAEDLGEVAASGVAGSLAAGAVVIGYSLAFWLGVRRRARRHRRNVVGEPAR